MRIATWNLERGGHLGVLSDVQGAVLGDLHADVLVLTEPHRAAPAPSLPTVASSARRVGNGDEEPWVAIAGPSVSTLDDGVIPFEHLAVAALAELDGVPTVVYGTVLPWRQITRQASGLVRAGETYAEAFHRVLQEQLTDLVRLREQFPEHMLVWAGDFNQSLVGPNLTGTTTGRRQLEAALSALDLVAWNANEPHARPGMSTIDLICGPDLGRIPRTTQIPTHKAGRRLSDHVGYVVEF